MFGRESVFFDGLLGMFSHIQKENVRKQYGIIYENGYDGVPHVNIPHKFYDIEPKGGYYFCSDSEGLIHVYTKEGKKLFEAVSIEYLGQETFLVSDKDINKEENKLGYALFRQEKILTDFIYRPHGMSKRFNKEGFIVLNGIKFMDTVILDINGKEVYREYGIDNPYITGMLCKTKKGYLNLLTDKYICKTGYKQVLETDECIFVQIDKGVYQINFKTGDYIVHGSDYKEEEILTKKEEEKRAEEKEAKRIAHQEREDIIESEAQKWNKLGRNDVCLCGSGKKLKNCCINTWKDTLRTRVEEGDKCS